MILPETMILFSKRSTVAVQHENGGPWTHAAIVGTGSHNHHNRSYTVRITTTGHIVTRNTKHFKTTSITAEQYLRDQLA